ncbi:MAG: polysaccharide pyruvyl transferase family protein [Bacteroidaceae bacterium]|nr:polysaccharide pyruvyl transferase family protein [Bacteroidaceae bacterium]
MKIAILTQPICNNYGGILQNYALQTLLERRGHSVTTLNYPIVAGYSGSATRHFLNTCRRFLQKLQGNPEIVWIDLGKEYKKKVELAHLQKVFLDKHLHLHAIQSPLTWEQIKRFGFETFVVGSDQVWRPRYNQGHLSNMFLDFTEGKNVKRYAYAASLGTDVWEFNALQTVQCAALAKQFDAISVREASGIALCKNYLGVEASHVLDPTLMLEAEDYLNLCSGNEHPQGDYIAVYTLDYTKEKMAIFNEVSRQLNIPLHLIGRFTKKGYPSMESWIEGIAHAKYVITDSFHGAVFSTIFQKQFVTLGNAARGNSRFTSLFTTLGIAEERQCNDVPTIIRLLKENIDYNTINKVKAEKQTISTKFLSDAGL